MPRDDKFTGQSPPQMYEKFWVEASKARQRSRAVKAGFGAVAGFLLALRFSIPAPVVAALVFAAGTAAVDLFLVWRAHEATGVWRGKRKGEAITGRRLRRSLVRHGYMVLNGRAVRGKTSIDHLVIGPGGVWIIDNEAWGPDIDIATYNGRLFLGEKYGSAVAKGLVDAADTFAEVLVRETGIQVEIEPLLSVHGGVLPRGGKVTAEGLTLLKPSLVARHIRGREGGVLSKEQVELLARTAARELHKLT
ncbi:nuclease-related domain-containing protein [Sinosporangium album]|uniref:nuclease-related domain-containing protein n=1 Tax=Sinosporangium album TaxID=504805 RepID=UPI001FE043FB|nr:nuclease-related domain-containing protein [Sinosporangium album]